MGLKCIWRPDVGSWTTALPRFARSWTFHDRSLGASRVAQRGSAHFAQRSYAHTKRTRCSRGRGVSAASRRMNSSGDISRCFGRLDLWINNAGITHRSPAHRTDPAVLRRVMAVDWQAPIELTPAALPLLWQVRGSIVTIGSMTGWMPLLGRAGYGAAKAALTQWFEVLRFETQDEGVHLLVVYPSFLDTPIERHALGADGAPAAPTRSTTGRVRSTEATVPATDRALARRARWLSPDPLARLGALL